MGLKVSESSSHLLSFFFPLLFHQLATYSIERCTDSFVTLHQIRPSLLLLRLSSGEHFFSQIISNELLIVSSQLFSSSPALPRL